MQGTRDVQVFVQGSRSWTWLYGFLARLGEPGETLACLAGPYGVLCRAAVNQGRQTDSEWDSVM